MCVRASRTHCVGARAVGNYVAGDACGERKGRERKREKRRGEVAITLGGTWLLRRGSCPGGKSTARSLSATLLVSRSLTCGLSPRPPATQGFSNLILILRPTCPPKPWQRRVTSRAIRGVRKKELQCWSLRGSGSFSLFASLREKFPFLSFLSLPFRNVLRFGDNLEFLVRHRGSLR